MKHTVPTSITKVIAPKGQRRVSQKTSGERGTNVSMAFAASATRQSIPPLYNFPRQNMRSVWTNNASPGIVGVETELQWIDSEESMKWMTNFALDATRRFEIFADTNRAQSLKEQQHQILK